MHHACLAEAAWLLGIFGAIVWVHEVHYALGAIKIDRVLRQRVQDQKSRKSFNLLFPFAFLYGNRMDGLMD